MEDPYCQPIALVTNTDPIDCQHLNECLQTNADPMARAIKIMRQLNPQSHQSHLAGGMDYGEQGKHSEV